MAAPFDLSGRVVLIAGATGGVGPAVTRACLDAGAKIVLVSRSHDKLEDLAASLGLPETDCLLHTADLTKPEEARDAVAATVGCFGRLDAVVSLVGHWEPGKISTTTPERWHAVLTTNLHSLFYLLHEAVPHMGPGGAIVTLGNEFPVEGKGGQLAYAVSKAGVHTLVQSLALELKPQQIRVNAILPSDIDTPDNRKYRPSGEPDKWVEPADVAQLVLFLLSSASSQISGALVPIRGWEVVN
jgi:NAD(P)-dependent dehydrogenase (short-subunit alcohol dehydrogenase family)